MESYFSAGHKEEWRDPGMEANCAKPFLPGHNNAATSHLQMVWGQISLKYQSHHKLIMYLFIMHLFNLRLRFFHFSPHISFSLLASQLMPCVHSICPISVRVCRQFSVCTKGSLAHGRLSSSPSTAYLAHPGGLGDVR